MLDAMVAVVNTILVIEMVDIKWSVKLYYPFGCDSEYYRIYGYIHSVCYESQKYESKVNYCWLYSWN